MNTIHSHVLQSSKSSLVNPSSMVSKDSWIVSLVRKRAGDDVNPEHAFLIVEGLTTKGFFIRRYDFFMDNSTPKKLEEHAGLVKLYDSGPASPTEIREVYTNKVFKTSDELTRGLLYKSWPITATEGATLHNNIVASELNPPKYNISGIKSYSAASSESSGLARGHNCFTWAVEQLEKLNNLTITNDSVMQKRWSDLVIAAPSRHLPEAGNNKGRCLIL